LPNDQVTNTRAFISIKIPCFVYFFLKDAQITLYGSLLFECSLKETSTIDIDVQFNETLAYETLKELLNIVRNWGKD
jgi:hypothetical protein